MVQNFQIELYFALFTINIKIKFSLHGSNFSKWTPLTIDTHLFSERNTDGYQNVTGIRRMDAVLHESLICYFLFYLCNK